MAMEKAAKKVETVANIGIVIVALLLVGLWLKGSLLHPSGSQHNIPIGSKISLKTVDWQTNGKSMVLALSTTCHFCTESAGFYRELAKECQKRNVRTVAVLPQPVNEARLYLANEGVSVDEIVSSPLADLQVAGTPTLLLVDQGARVRGAWYGKLPETSEKDVIAGLAR
ncbi:MAG TPA: hypothetical protein VGK22_12540 [Candidatus Angelobacter sp.]